MYGSTILGNDGNDKLVMGNNNTNQYGYGGDGDDIIYGGDGFDGLQVLTGDYSVSYGYGLELGGNDKIYGGSNATGEQIL